MTEGPDSIERLGRWTARLPFVRGRQPEPLPLALDRRRIYVLPTRLGLLVAVLLLAMLLGGLNYNNNAALLLAFLLAAIVHNSVVMAHFGLSGLALLDADAAPVHAGERLRLRVRWSAGPRDREGIELRLDERDTRLAPLQAGAEGEAIVEAPAPRRGWWQPARLRVSTVRPLGLARAWSWWTPALRVLVYPALERDVRDFPGDGGEGSARPRARRSGEDTHHLRDYRPGDPPRQVAWRASARADRLLVREAEAGVQQDLVLAWEAVAALPVEARISRLARWVVEADRQGRRWQLRLPGETLGPARGAAHRHACLRALALLPGAAS